MNKMNKPEVPESTLINPQFLFLYYVYVIGYIFVPSAGITSRKLQ